MTTADQIADPVWALIDAITNVDTFDAEDPAPSLDEDGRVHAYAVYYPSPGWARSITLDAVPDLLDWSCQISCVGGDRTRALWCIGKVRAALTGKWITVDGQSVQIREVGDPGPLRRDETVSPHRFWAPLHLAVSAA